MQSCTGKGARRMVIDCHVHAFPSALGKSPRTWASVRGEFSWADLVEPAGQRSLQGWADADELIAAMDAAGVDQAILQGWYWERAATCHWHNELMAEWVGRFPKRLKFFAAVAPGEGPAATLEVLEAAEALGACGVGELLGQVQGFTFEGEAWRHLAEWVQARDWPICLHVTEAAGHTYPGRVETPLMDYVELLRTYPALKVILAHWGGGLPFFFLNPKLRPLLKNVYFDCAASPLLYKDGVFPSVVEMVGVEHLLFGSDFPLRLYAKHTAAAGLKRFVDEVRDMAKLTEAQRAALLGGNARRLLSPE